MGAGAAAFWLVNRAPSPLPSTMKPCDDGHAMKPVRAMKTMKAIKTSVELWKEVYSKQCNVRNQMARFLCPASQVRSKTNEVRKNILQEVPVKKDANVKQDVPEAQAEDSKDAADSRHGSS